MLKANEMVCDSEGGHNNIEGLEEYLEEFQGQSVSIEQIGCVSQVKWWNVFQLWKEYGKLIFSSEDEENYWFVDVKAIVSWAIDFINDAIDIILSNGMILVICKN